MLGEHGLACVSSLDIMPLFLLTTFHITFLIILTRRTVLQNSVNVLNVQLLLKKQMLRRHPKLTKKLL
jgi:hypothetical protein